MHGLALSLRSLSTHSNSDSYTQRIDLKWTQTVIVFCDNQNDKVYLIRKLYIYIIHYLRPPYISFNVYTRLCRIALIIIIVRRTKQRMQSNSWPYLNGVQQSNQVLEFLLHSTCMLNFHSVHSFIHPIFGHHLLTTPPSPSSSPPPLLLPPLPTTTHQRW